MGLRGPKAGDVPQAAPISARVRVELRDKLAALAAANHRSLSQEIEAQLTDAMARDLHNEIDGDVQFAILRAIAEVIRVSENRTGRFVSEDPFTYAIMAAGVASLLAKIGPAGDPTPPDNYDILDELRAVPELAAEQKAKLDTLPISDWGEMIGGGVVMNLRASLAGHPKANLQGIAETLKPLLRPRE